MTMENQNTLSPSSPPLPPPPPPPPSEEPDSKKLKMSTTTATTSDDEDRTTNTANAEKKPRYKRRKIAILFAYCGVGYQGMQKNPGAKTIEGDLEEALFFSGAVPEQDRGCPKRFDFARSARTDKGVSAVGQVVSGKFYVDPPGFVERLNNNLPPQFRIFGYKRVTASFSAKKFCDRRRYVYLLPVFALDPTSHRDRESVLASVGSENELVKCLDCSERGRKVEIHTGISSNTSTTLPGSNGKSLEKSSSVSTDCNNNSSSDAVNGVDNGESVTAVKENVFSYGDKEKERFNKILKQYEGTHNFHNFTTRTKAADPSANRYIISFHANTTVTVDGIEFVKCEVVGQSFMLHQIRKMIGVAVAIMRNCAPESLMETALQQDVRITVPTAPEVGLYLDECFFSSYNQKWKDTHEEVSMKAYTEEAEEFKLKHIYSHIASTEHKEGAVAVWLHSLNYRNYPDLCSQENGSPTTQLEATTRCNPDILNHNQKANPSKKPDPMLALITSGRVRIWPLPLHWKTTISEVNLDHLATTIKNRLNRIFPYLLELGNRDNHYRGSEADIIADVNILVDTAMAVTYNRLRKILQRYDPTAFAARMNPRSPYSNRFKFPTFLSSVLSSIGPLRITDGPVNAHVVYATSSATCRNYGRAEQFNFSSRYDHFIECLEAMGVPCAPIDVKSTDCGSFFSTVIPTFEHGVWRFTAPFHHSHYEPKDIVSAWLTQNDDPALRAFEDLSVTIGLCTDPKVVDAVAGVDGDVGSTRLIGGTFPVNVSGIRPAGCGSDPAGVYIVGRGSERYYCTLLAQRICPDEMYSLLREYIFHPPKESTSF
ncbi:tRNA pseudouridine synthase 1 isoform X2 [Lactuca sativa]|uniref:tRNA pseudouridine synthase 1 isoform X2 n=1 Tax=Lactuca sativa TaxID=4236 RepID=UPI000CD99ED7|nr:tRNA pseudouridine synthase 1 isoform X2 [Lactuca sativa]